MAYIDPEHGWFTPVQSDLNWAQTFRMTLRAPAIANRIFDTLAHAQSYIDDYSDKASAVPGIVLCVTSDSNVDNNGMWLVLSVKESSSGAAGTMRRVDERTVFNVTNLTTDLAKYTTPGIYFFTNTTTGKGYVMFVEKNSSNETIQTLMNSSGYQYRTGSNAETPVWTNYTSRTYLTGADVDAALSDSSTNPVQNKVLKELLDNLASQIGTVSGGTAQAVYQVADYTALLALEAPQEGVIYITADTQSMYVYNAATEQFTDVTNSIVNGVIYVKTTLDNIFNLTITKGIYTVVFTYDDNGTSVCEVYSLMATDSYRRVNGELVPYVAMTLSNAKKFAEKEFDAQDNPKWTWHTYSFQGHTHTTDSIYTLDGETLSTRLANDKLLIYAGLA